MSSLRLLLRTIWYFRAANAAAALASAVGAAVLAGSLLVGRSMRLSLERIVERGLGDVDYVVTAPHFFGESLARRLEAQAGWAERFARADPLLATAGSASGIAPGRVATRVTVFGRSSVPSGSCVISEALAQALGADVGSVIVLRMDRLLGPAAALPGSAERTDLAVLRLRVGRVASGGGLEDAFSLHPSQRAVRNAWVNLGELQVALGQPGCANALLVSSRARPAGSGAQSELAALARALGAAARSEDYGLRVSDVGEGALSIESSQIVMPGPVEEAVRAALSGSTAVFAYLAETIRDVDTRKEIPYSMVAGLDTLSGEALREGRIALNRHAAEDLGARPGHRISLEYPVRSAGGLLERRSAEFVLDRVIECSGFGADRTLVPEFKGITDAASVASWRPPRDFEFRPERIRPIDEDYWHRFGPAPKAFVSLADAKKLWGTPSGSLTSIRVSGFGRGAVERAILERLSPETAGLAARALRAEALEAARGGTEFGGLFSGMSSFIFASSVLLVALVMQLHVEQRRRQIGLLAALGFAPARVRRLLLAESAIVLAAGSALGGAASFGFAGLVLGGLRTVWFDAVGTKALALEPAAAPVVAGALAAFGAGMLAVRWASRQVLAMHPVEALAGRRPDQAPPGRRSTRALSALAVLALASAALVGWALLSEGASAAAAFFAAGACLLGAFLALARAGMASAARASRGSSARGARLTLATLAWRNVARSSRRSLLAAGLLAAGSFVTVAVGIMAPAGAASSAGEYLVAEFDAAIPYDLAERKGRELLGLADHEALLGPLRIVCLRTSPGEDASCRNLLRPQRARIVAASCALAEGWGLEFASTAADAADPWALLERGLQGDSIAAFADYGSARWILKKSLGDTLHATDERGRPRELRLAALLESSIFQGDILIGERAFAELFPGRTGYGMALIGLPPGSKADLARIRGVLEMGLADFGASLQTSSERLASFARVSAAYVSAFQALGSLGVLLGTAGLFAVFARSVAERRAEIALLWALGFAPLRAGLAVSLEFALLVGLGVVSGCAAATVAVAPEFARAGGRIAPAAGALAFYVVMAGAVCAALAAAGVLVAATASPQALRQE